MYLWSLYILYLVKLTTHLARKNGTRKSQRFEKELPGAAALYHGTSIRKYDQRKFNTNHLTKFQFAFDKHRSIIAKTRKKRVYDNPNFKYLDNFPFSNFDADRASQPPKHISFSDTDEETRQLEFRINKRKPVFPDNLDRMKRPLVELTDDTAGGDRLLQ